MWIYTTILAVWACEVRVFILQFNYFLLQGCEGLFHWLLELIYVWLVQPAEFSWPSGSWLLFIMLLIRILLGISPEMGWWVTCISAVVSILVFLDLLVIVLIFFLFLLPFLANTANSDTDFLTTGVLVYFYKIWRAIWRSLGMQSSPVVK